MEKINIAELLKKCPKGMELDCTIYDNLYFDYIREHTKYPIVCYTVDSKGVKNEITFNRYGKYALNATAKCVIFPKGKTTWEGFVPPFKFKDGDIVVNASNEYSNAFVYAGEDDDYYKSYVGLMTGTNPELSTRKSSAWVSTKSGIRLATEEEKQKLFKAIKDKGYAWNPETKVLEKLAEPTTHKILSDALATFGAERQRIMCMEECAELIDALAKYDRGRADAKDVITELADVSIMVEQMTILFGKKEFEAEKERKMERLQELIKENENRNRLLLRVRRPPCRRACTE